MKKSVALPDALLRRLVCDVFGLAVAMLSLVRVLLVKGQKHTIKTTIFQHFIGGAA